MGKFEIGQLVRLKSGGPVMTVEGETDRGEICCVWFPNVSSEPMRHNFPFLTLERAV